MQAKTHSFHLLQHFVFNVDVLKHSLYDHIGILKATVIQPAGQITQDTVPLKRCDVLLLGFVIEPGKDVTIKIKRVEKDMVKGKSEWRSSYRQVNKWVDASYPL